MSKICLMEAIAGREGRFDMDLNDRERQENSSVDEFRAFAAKTSRIKTRINAAITQQPEESVEREYHLLEVFRDICVHPDGRTSAYDTRGRRMTSLSTSPAEGYMVMVPDDDRSWDMISGFCSLDEAQAWLGANRAPAGNHPIEPKIGTYVETMRCVGGEVISTYQTAFPRHEDTGSAPTCG